MNSKERKEKRYQRRQIKRKSKISSIPNQEFDTLFSFHNLYKSAKKCCNHARWKSNIISFETYLLKRIQEIYDAIHNGNREFTGFHSFTSTDRGKVREINSLPLNERTMQKCLCTNLLIPLFSRTFINDNSACMKNKGMSFAFKRLTKQLSHHYRLYGHEGGIYQFDFKDYFLSLPHDEIKKRLRSKIKDDKIYNLASSFIDDFLFMKGSLRPNEPYGVSLGTEISYIMALEFANPIDHYIKDVLGIKGYGRYMDDGYIISNSLSYLHLIKSLVHNLVEDYGVKLNDKKDKIIPFKSHSFTFLKMRIHLDEKGKVVMRLSKNSIKAMRRKLHKFRNWLDNPSSKHYKKIEFNDIVTSYRSWRAYAKLADSYRTLHNMDIYFIKLFENELRNYKHKLKCTVKAVYEDKGWKYNI